MRQEITFLTEKGMVIALTMPHRVEISLVVLNLETRQIRRKVFRIGH